MSKAETVEVIDIPSLRRVKQSEELLANLYVVEQVGEQRPVDARTINMLATVSVVSILVLVATMLLRYNTFVTMFEEASAMRGNLEAAIQRRDNLFGNLVKLTLNHAALEHAIYGHTSDKRTEGMNGKLPENLQKLLNNGGNDALGLSKMLAVVEQYPTIQSADTYKHMMTSLEEAEDRIALRRVDYNTSMSIYNIEITKWPWDYLAKVTGFKKMEYFQQKPDDTPIIAPQMFQELLPLGQGGNK
jgi:LemA protein